MPRAFDPQAHLRSFREFRLSFELQREKSKFLPFAVGHAAVDSLNSVIAAWLVGLHADILPALHVCREWLEDSIERDERFGDNPEYAASQRSLALGVANWMLDQSNTIALFRDSTDRLEQAWAHNWAMHQPATVAQQIESLDDYAACCLQSGEYARALTCFDRLGVDYELATPASITNVTRLGGWLCLSSNSGHSPGSDLPRIFRRCLDKHMATTWLGHGQYLRAACWLKIVYWHTGLTTDAASTIAKAYEHMPGVQRP
jgi:hypothetical protein